MIGCCVGSSPLMTHTEYWVLSLHPHTFFNGCFPTCLTCFFRCEWGNKDPGSWGTNRSCWVYSKLWETLEISDTLCSVGTFLTCVRGCVDLLKNDLGLCYLLHVCVSGVYSHACLGDGPPTVWAHVCVHAMTIVWFLTTALHIKQFYWTDVWNKQTLQLQ